MKRVSKILLATALMFIIGMGLFVFSSCDDLNEGEEGILPHEHIWGEWNVIEESTCTEGGKMELYCSLCGYTKSVELDKKGHTEGEWEITREATCAEIGKRVIRCLVCDDVIKSEIISKLEHTYSGWVVDSEATCTEDGRMHNECTSCGYTAKQTILASGHAISEWTVETEPTCTNSGLKVGTCQTCGEVNTITIPANGHTDGEWITVSNPTCTEEGKKHILCSVCGEVIDEEILPAGHIYNDNEECILCGIKLSPEGQKIVFKFGNNGEAKHIDGNDLGKEIAYTFEEYTLSFTDMYKIFGPSFDAHGNSCIKIGAMKYTGTLSFTVPDEVYAVIIRIAKYKDYESKVIINGTEYTLTKNSHDGEYDRIIVDTSITKTVTISTVDDGKRAMMNSIALVLAPDAGECQHSGGNATCQNKATCTICGEEYGELGEHSYVDSNCCYDCGNIDISYFDFTLLDDGTYAISAKDASTLPSKVVVPAEYNNDAVTKISIDGLGSSSATTIIISEGIAEFDVGAFGGSSKLTTLVIPKSATFFHDHQCLGCDQLSYVFYAGTAEEWENINFCCKYDGNPHLLYAPRYYYSETAPTTEGNFWHWVDGEPTVWK